MNRPEFLVTGGTGFLGRHVLRAINAAGHPATVLVRNRGAWFAQPWVNKGRDEIGEVRVIEGDLLASANWQSDASLASVTTIIHTAAVVKHSRTDTEEMTQLIVAGTLQMVHVAKQLGARLVFVSTSGTVGCFRFPDITADEDSPYADDLVGRWPYYAAKICAEREARRLAHKLDVELVIVRPPVLLGPDDHRLRSTGYVLRALERRIPAIPPGSMHFTDIRDVATALMRISELRLPRPIYHLPGNHSSLAEFCAMITEVSGVPSSTHRLPTTVALGLATVGGWLPWRPNWLPDPVVLEMSTRHWGLTSLFAHEIGYAPRPARQTLTDTVAWLQSLHHHEDNSGQISKTAHV